MSKWQGYLFNGGYSEVNGKGSDNEFGADIVKFHHIMHLRNTKAKHEVIIPQPLRKRSLKTMKNKHRKNRSLCELCGFARNLLMR